MLTKDPAKKITVAQVLEHPWIRVGGEASDKPMDSAVLTRMKQFRAMNMLKKLALKIIAQSMSDEDIKGLKAMFANIDTENSGTITYEEMRAGLTRLGSKLLEAEVKELMEAADVDGNGTIDYLEFIMVMMSRHRMDSYENLQKAFTFFDKDNSGCYYKLSIFFYLGQHIEKENEDILHTHIYQCELLHQLVLNASNESSLVVISKGIPFTQQIQQIIQ